MAARFVSAQLEIESPRPLGYVLEAFSGEEIVSFDYRESKRGFSVAFVGASVLLGIYPAPPPGPED